MRFGKTLLTCRQLTLCEYVILINSKFLFSLNHHKPRTVQMLQAPRFSKKTCLKTAANPGSFLRCFFPLFYITSV